MKTAHLLPLLVLMAALTALSMDIYLPSMHDLAGVFQTTPDQVAMTLSAFVFAFAFGQLLYGPLSDRYGRRRPLFGGILLYLIANLICASATSIEGLILGRALEGLGACSGTFLCSAIVRDVFNGEERTRAMAKIASCVALAPITAPLMGAYLHTAFGWRASFLFLTGFSVILLALVIRALPETCVHRTNHLRIRVYGEVMAHPVWRAWSVVNIFSFGALFAYIGTSSALLVGYFGLSPETYGLWFSTNAVTYLLGSALVSRVRLSPSSLALWGIGQILLGGLLMLVLPSWGVLGPLSVSGPMYLVTSGVALSMPAGAAAALEPFPQAAGAAAALQGFLRFALAACVIFMTSHLPFKGGVPLGIVVLACGGVSFVGWLAIRASQLTAQNKEWQPALGG